MNLRVSFATTHWKDCVRLDSTSQEKASHDHLDIVDQARIPHIGLALGDLFEGECQIGIDLLVSSYSFKSLHSFEGGSAFHSTTIHTDEQSKSGNYIQHPRQGP